jgi:hypothetical protein
MARGDMNDSFRKLAVVGALGAACASCGGTTRLTVARGADYASVPHATVSVLGVYRDGRMSLDAWTDLGPPLSRPMSTGAPCAIAFGKVLWDASPALAGAIDDYARDVGVTDALVDRLGASAQGDLVLIVQVWGRLPEKRTSTPAQSSPATGRGGRRMPPPQRQQTKEESREALEMSATLFSRAVHHPVAVVSLRYTGDNADEAVEALAEKLGDAFPGTTCVGWNELAIEPDAIRRLPRPELPPGPGDDGAGRGVESSE